MKQEIVLTIPYLQKNTLIEYILENDRKQTRENITRSV